MHPIKHMMEHCFKHGISTRIVLPSDLLRRDPAYFGITEEMIDTYEHGVGEDGRGGHVVLVFGPAKFIPYYEAVFGDDAVELNVSFNTIHRMTIPYAVIGVACVIGTVDMDWQPPGANRDADDPPDAPTLRLVK